MSNRGYRFKSNGEKVELLSDNHIAKDGSIRCLFRCVKTDESNRPFHVTFETFPNGLVNGSPMQPHPWDVEVIPQEVFVLVGLSPSGEKVCDCCPVDDKDKLLTLSEKYKGFVGANWAKVEVKEGRIHVPLFN